MTALEFHPFANLFPLIEGADFDDLVEDVRARGVHDPIDLWQGKILDGRNRYRAAQAAGVEIGPQNLRHFRPELYGDPLDYVLSKNLKRRHLDESQRALVAARLANMVRGRPSEKPANLPDLSDPAHQETAANEEPTATVTQDRAAQMLNISPRLLRAAKAVQDRAEPELTRAVEQGKIAVSAAAQAVDLDAETQRKIAAEAESGHVNVARKVIKQERREAREAELGAKQQSMPKQKFGVILADPEWKWKPWSDAGMDRGVENTYPTSETTDIAARDVRSIAADDCVLVLWARADMLPEALQVLTAWGFRYVAQRVWRKSRMSTGYWFRYDHELVLIGSRGHPVAPAMGTQERSVFEGEPAVPGLNSSKPECVAEWIERNWPNTPKIELNRRGPARPGWSAWGYEAEQTNAETQAAQDPISQTVHSENRSTEAPPSIEEYASPHIFDGVRPLSSERAEKLRQAFDDSELDIPDKLRRDANNRAPFHQSTGALPPLCDRDAPVNSAVESVTAPANFSSNEDDHVEA